MNKIELKKSNFLDSIVLIFKFFLLFSFILISSLNKVHKMDAYNFSVICKIHTLNTKKVVIDINIPINSVNIYF